MELRRIREVRARGHAGPCSAVDPAGFAFASARRCGGGRAATGLALVAMVAAVIVLWYAFVPVPPIPSGNPAGSCSVHQLPRVRGGTHAVSGRVACGVHVGRREPERFRHLRQGDRRGGAALTDFQSRTGREPGLVTRRHPDRLPPRQARGRLEIAASSLPAAEPSPGSARYRGWPTRNSVVFRRPLPGRRGIDCRLENVTVGILFALNIADRLEGEAHLATSTFDMQRPCRRTVGPSPSPGS